MLPDASENSENQHSQTGKHSPLCPLFHSPLPCDCFLHMEVVKPNHLNTKFYCAFSAMTVPISLSLSTPVPKLLSKIKLPQTSVPRSPVHTSVQVHCSCTLLNLRCSTTHVLSSDHTDFLLLLMWQSDSFHEPRSLLKPSLTLQVLL
jgi:hypothetical protein